MEPREFFLSPFDSDEIHRFLREHGLDDPNRAERILDRIVDLTGRPERLAELGEELFPALHWTADPVRSLVQLEAFLEASPSRPSLLSWLLDVPGTLTELLKLLGNSPFLGQILVRNPEYVYWLFEPGRLDRCEQFKYYLKVASESLRFEHPETSLDSLRRLRRRETLRIAAQDILEKTSFRHQVEQISDLATAMIQACLELCNRRTQGRFAVFAMGNSAVGS